MDLEIYTDDKGYYIRRPSHSVVLRWYREEDRWVSTRERMPACCTRVDFADLPADLREEVLASAVRAEAMDDRMG